MNTHTTNHSISHMSSVAEQAAREAGELLLSRLRTQVEISKKGRINLVTEMDVQAEEAIVDRILGNFPEHQILAEEQGTREGTAACRWIIDPLDGTTNYAHGYRFFCVSIALEIDDQMALGVVSDPVTEELFSARRGQGAFLNGDPIHVSRENELVDSLVCTGFSYDREEIEKNLEFFNRFVLNTRGVRRDGSAALDLCYVACGRFDGFWELSLHPWDVAAGKLIVEEAGGHVSRFDGSPFGSFNPEVLATNAGIHDAMMELLA